MRHKEKERKRQRYKKKERKKKTETKRKKENEFDTCKARLAQLVNNILGKQPYKMQIFQQNTKWEAQFFTVVLPK